MLFLDEAGIPETSIDWHAVIDTLQSATAVVRSGDFAQPVKPYLRYRDKKNRIIAMPAFLGGSFNSAGIKWIASFPDNIQKDIPRAHSVSILNDADTGVPYCIINTNRVSAIRTAGVSGLLVKKFLQKHPDRLLRIGISGAGPIGLQHIQMMEKIAADRISTISIFDIRDVHREEIGQNTRSIIEFCGSWQQAYVHADIFITCTVAKERYIDLPPKKGSLHLNVSLRDYLPEAMTKMDVMIVDDWEEVCRENTDIQHLHLKGLLDKNNTWSLSSQDFESLWASVDPHQTIMFNPMGMAVYDIAIAKYFFELSVQKSIPTKLYEIS